MHAFVGAAAAAPAQFAKVAQVGAQNAARLVDGLLEGVLNGGIRRRVGVNLKPCTGVQRGVRFAPPVETAAAQ